MAFEIRPAAPGDAGTILAFIRELAEYEKEPEAVVTTEAELARNLFNPVSSTEAVIGLEDGQPVGFAVYFQSFSTWLGRDGLYLEDLYVSPDRRGCGYGKALLRHLAQLAVQRGCGRFEWSVLDWNEPAIRFYESLGAQPLSEWIAYRLEGDALHQLATSA